ncbi:MAG: S-layer homology domain-containing protein [Oscillospiraceae bacterium]|nr:S-layer homology domain-containing protein [Clostridiales bacterium]MDY2717397.1 S-layer homology domain-containing protein [Oscillospiraceae bacterium]
MAVVSFASDATNDTNGFKDMTKSSNVSSVKDTINNLTAGGGTLVDKGIETANKIFEKNPLSGTSKRNRVMIVFTDGAPGSYGDWKSASEATANSAIIAAKASKDTYKATVFTIGIFAGAQNSLPIPDYTQYTFWGPYEVSPSDADQTKNSNRFMHLVSTNYPEATNITTPNTQNSKTGYYLTASDSASLNNVFQQISNQIQDVKTTSLDQNAVVKDVVGDSFTFTGTESDVKVKTAAFDNIVDGQYKFETTEKDFTDARIDVDGKTITVTNFNFKEQWCGFDTNNGNQTKHGNKLIIEFKVGVGTTGSDSGQIPTNNGDASILDKAGDGATSVVSVASPTVKGYQVTYDPGVDGEAVTDMPSDSKYFITGTTVDEKEPKRAGYNFTGWKKSGDTTNTTYHGEDEITFDGDDVELIAQWTAKTISVNLKDFVEKQFTMTGLNELTNEEEFIVTVKQTKPGTTTEQSYTGKVKFKEAGIKPFEFTSNPGLTYGNEYEFEVEETEGSTSGIAYDKTKHTLKLSVVTNNNGDLEVIGEKVTVKNSYTQTYTLTYDANGGTGSVPEDNTKYNYNQSVALQFNPLPTHASVGGYNVVFLGWSETQITTIYDSEPAGGTLIYNITMDADKTVYAVWGYDKNKNGNPDFYDATATYNIVNGKWSDSSTTKTEIVKVKEKNANGQWVPTNNKLQHIPSTADVIPNTGYTQSGNWDTTPSSESVFTQDTTYTYTLQKTEEVTVTYEWTGLENVTFDTALTEPGPDSTPKNADYTVDTGYYDGKTVQDSEGNVYKFSGWTPKTDGITIVNGQIKSIQTNVTLTGHWAKLDSNIFRFGDIIKKSFTAEENSNPIPYANGENYEFYAVVKQQSGPVDIENFSSENGVTIFATFDNGHQTNGAFSFNSNGEIKFKAAGEYTFRVEETTPIVPSTVKGTVTVDLDQYLLTIKVDKNLNVTQTYFTALPQTDGTEAEKMDKIIFKNKYYEDPNADDVTLDLSRYVTKTFESRHGKSATETFEAKVQIWLEDVPAINAAKEEDAIAVYAEPEWPKEYTGTVTLSTGETKHFDFGGSITLDRNHRYRIRVTETAGSNTDVEYDKTVYETYVNFVGETKEVKWDKYNGNFSFTNTYTGIDDYYPIIIPTIINKDTGMLNKTDHFAYVIGYPDGTVHPNGQITRAEVATIFFRLLRDEVRDGAFTTSNTYSDVAYGKWYNNPISTMSALGIITGYPDGTFKPNKPITRAEFAAIAARFDETQSGKSATFSDVIGHWAAKEIGIAYYNDWIKGYPDGTFKPDQNITRAEAMTLINRVLERKPESPADLLTNMNKWTDNMDTSKWYYLDVQEATNSHGYTRKTFNYELWRQMLPDPDWSRYER